MTKYANIRKYSKLIQNMEDTENNDDTEHIEDTCIENLEHCTEKYLTILESQFIKIGYDIQKEHEQLIKISDFLLIDSVFHNKLIKFSEVCCISHCLSNYLSISRADLLDMLHDKYIYNKSDIDDSVNKIIQYMCTTKGEILYRDNGYYECSNYEIHCVLKNHFRTVIMAKIVNPLSFYGYIEILDYIVTKYDYKFDHININYAVENGLIEVIKIWNKYGIKICIDDVSRAAENGHIETVKFLMEEYNLDISSDYDIVNKVAKTGRNDIINLLIDVYNAPYSSVYITVWIKYNYIETFNLLREKYKIPYSGYDEMD